MSKKLKGGTLWSRPVWYVTPETFLVQFLGPTVFLKFQVTSGVSKKFKQERQEQSMNNHSSQKVNQSQSITMKTQPILPDRLRAKKPEKERIGSEGNGKR